MIYESPRIYDMHSPAPYWLPQNSLGSIITMTSPQLSDWLQGKRIVAETNEPPIDYRPTLHRIHQSDQFLGLRELFVSDAVELVVYLPLLDRLMLEKRKASGIIQTAIYRANSVAVVVDGDQVGAGVVFAVELEVFGDTLLLDEHGPPQGEAAGAIGGDLGEMDVHVEPIADGDAGANEAHMIGSWSLPAPSL
jgi:hypothetical protein